MTGQGRAVRDRAGQGRAGQGRAVQFRTGQHRAGRGESKNGFVIPDHMDTLPPIKRKIRKRAILL